MVGRLLPAANDVQATFCATLVDEWIRLGVTHAVVAPGSRSTPMALAITDRAELAVHVVHDERVAAFVALGLGLDGDPALLLCTSGTASANFFPAVVEAGLSAVPMIVLTADRPEELRGVGAPQTIDQVELYGTHVRWHRDAGVADDSERSLWRGLAGDAWVHAAAGPIHLNLPFREPLLGTAGDLPPIVESASRRTLDQRRDIVPNSVRVQRGVILAGGNSGVPALEVAELHRRTGWPILADPMSGMRHLDGAISSADALLRHRPFAAAMRPEVIVRIGRPCSSKVVAQWSATVAGNGVDVIQVGGPGVIDPDHNVVAVCDMASLLAALPEGHTGSVWLAGWLDGDAAAQRAMVEALDGYEVLTEPGVARTVAEHLPAGADLTVASSMPIRDLEWFGGRSARAHANRGANGIDGVLSTALGRGLAGPTSVALLGDLAFVHDSNALVGLSTRGVDLRVVVVDNDGGGIFSFLPQFDELSESRFEQLFGTPLGVDVLAIAAAHRIPAATLTTAGELADRLQQPGPWLVRVPSNRADNVAVHEHIHAAVTAALP